MSAMPEQISPPPVSPPEPPPVSPPEQDSPAPASPAEQPDEPNQPDEATASSGEHPPAESPATAGAPDDRQLRRQARLDHQTALTDAVRALIDVTIRTRAEDAALDAVTESIKALTATLAADPDPDPGPLGLVRRPDGGWHVPGNPMVGARNPMAPPLTIERNLEEQWARTSFTVGAPFEGPPACLHGGMAAAIIDQVFGTAAATTGRPGMTAYLNLTYRRPTFLGVEHTVHADVVERGRWKTLVRGAMRDAEGKVTVEAEGLFVVPAMARAIESIPMSDAT